MTTEAMEKRALGRNDFQGHLRLDARSLALDRLIALRLRERPERLEIARAILERWRNVCAPRVQPVLAEWGSILDEGLEATVGVLAGEEERSVPLRQSADPKRIATVTARHCLE